LPKTKRKQSGAALLLALLVVAVVAVIASAVLSREHFAIGRTFNLNDDVRMQSAASSAQVWANQQLKAQQYKQRWPLTMKPFHVDNMVVDAKLIDVQGRFNINNLLDGGASSNFQQLLEASDLQLGPPIYPPMARDLDRAVSSWFVPLGNPASLDDVYAESHPPYRSGHQMMVSVSELRLVAGFDAKLYQAISPYLAALPKTHTPININTASMPVLFSMATGMTPSIAQAIMKQREEAPFTSIEAFKKFPPVKSLAIDSKMTVQSEYFLLLMRVSLGSQVLYLRSLLQRQPTHDSVVVKPLWQLRAIT
jgi:general secretion pathway protein K